jgi:hypothetical protein
MYFASDYVYTICLTRNISVYMPSDDSYMPTNDTYMPTNGTYMPNDDTYMPTDNTYKGVDYLGGEQHFLDSVL